MPTATVQQGQNLMDVAIEKCGTAAALFELALLNGYSITEDVLVGTELDLPPVVNIGVAQYFADKQIVPASGELNNKQLEILEPQGIGHWRIGLNFKVS